ncbi:tripartite tricarboxylate transporter substrate-binding protein [Allopusillimonas ginsengisoli]|uniref:tripartite tricarboxylate transporter substrate-binding protein n=1 Tax=Allopusillimonas ginsengisoli TaxID=453575 RepID=UPI0039C1748E
MFGIVAPAGAPADIIAQLSSTLAQSVQHGAPHQKLTDRGFTPIGSTPEQFEQRIHEEVAKWTELIQKGGFKAE